MHVQQVSTFHPSQQPAVAVMPYAMQPPMPSSSDDDVAEVIGKRVYGAALQFVTSICASDAGDKCLCSGRAVVKRLGMLYKTNKKAFIRAQHDVSSILTKYELE